MLPNGDCRNSVHVIQRTVNPGSLQAGTRIAFDPSHKGVDSLDVNKQQDLLKRTQFGTLRQTFNPAEQLPAVAPGTAHTPREAWQEENPQPHGENTTYDELTHVQEMYPAAAAGGEH